MYIIVSISAEQPHVDTASHEDRRATDTSVASILMILSNHLLQHGAYRPPTPFSPYVIARHLSSVIVTPPHRFITPFPLHLCKNC